MNNITTYFATRKNVFLWLASLLSIISAVSRIIFLLGTGDVVAANPILFVCTPIIANLIIAIRYPLRAEKQFYITILPIVMLSIYLISAGNRINDSFFISIAAVVLILIFAILYFITFIGRIKTKYVVLFYLIAICVIAAVNGTVRMNIINYYPERKWLLCSDFSIILSVLALLLSAKKMGPYKEGDPYRLQFGDRLDGRRVHGMPIMTKVTPHLMPTRVGRSNYISDTVEITEMEEFIRQKRAEGYKQFGIMHVVIASYVRTTAEFPELNRFVAGQKVYHRYETSVNMVVKKEMNKEAADSSVKVLFDPADTATDVYEKFNAAVEKAREQGISNGYDSITYVLDYLPSVIMALFGWLVRFLDYFSILPMPLERVSPFHGSMFITAMGSLGIPPIYHHLYDLGTVPVFCALGHKYTKNELNKEGEPVTRKYIDYKVVCDEGICDGFYYAAAMKKMRGYLKHPAKLDFPPARVVEDIY